MRIYRFNLCSGLSYLENLCRGRREKGRKTGWHRLLLWAASGANTALLVNPSTFKYSIVPSMTPVTSPCSIFTKEPEFRAWLVEERKMNPERMSKDQNKKEFARFVEDYNTGPSC